MRVPAGYVLVPAPAGGGPSLLRRIFVIGLTVGVVFALVGGQAAKAATETQQGRTFDGWSSNAFLWEGAVTRYQAGEARYTLVLEPGARVYARWECNDVVHPRQGFSVPAGAASAQTYVVSGANSDAATVVMAESTSYCAFHVYLEATSQGRFRVPSAQFVFTIGYAGGGGGPGGSVDPSDSPLPSGAATPEPSFCFEPLPSDFYGPPETVPCDPPTGGVYQEFSCDSTSGVGCYSGAIPVEPGDTFDVLMFLHSVGCAAGSGTDCTVAIQEDDNNDWCCGSDLAFYRALNCGASSVPFTIGWDSRTDSQDPAGGTSCASWLTGAPDFVTVGAGKHFLRMICYGNYGADDVGCDATLFYREGGTPAPSASPSPSPSGSPAPSSGVGGPGTGVPPPAGGVGSGTGVPQGGPRGNGLADCETDQAKPGQRAYRDVPDTSWPGLTLDLGAYLSWLGSLVSTVPIWMENQITWANNTGIDLLVPGDCVGTMVTDFGDEVQATVPFAWFFDVQDALSASPGEEVSVPTIELAGATIDPNDAVNAAAAAIAPFSGALAAIPWLFGALLLMRKVMGTFGAGEGGG